LKTGDGESHPGVRIPPPPFFFINVLIPVQNGFRRMFTCVPTSILSWQFRIIGLRGDADVGFNFWSEEGVIRLESEEYRIFKPGFLIGCWMLQRGGRTISEARKPSAFLRRFELKTADGEFLVKARSPIGRSFDIFAQDRHIGEIRPEHAFTRRATIDCSDEISPLDQLFSFWLAALTWRRRQQSG
jgi:hypothetical protein